jgi:hypothetical protein
MSREARSGLGSLTSDLSRQTRMTSRASGADFVEVRVGGAGERGEGHALPRERGEGRLRDRGAREGEGPGQLLEALLYGLWHMLYGLWSMVYGLWSRP